MTEEREARWAAAMRAARRGDDAGYARLLGEMAGVLRAFVRRRLSGVGLSPHDAEDVVQEAGEKLGMNAGAVRVALHRGLKRLARLGGNDGDTR